MKNVDEPFIISRIFDYLMERAPTIDLPLHGGHAPPWLINLMKELSKEVCNIIINEYGTEAFLSRISDPLWFQSFGCVLGYDWHSSGVTTVVTGVIKTVLNEQDLGIIVAGGKGRKSRKVPDEILELSKKIGIDDPSKFIRVSRLVAKIDNNLIQSGHVLYHHVILIDEKGNWAVVQQGMNENEIKARRYHWFSKNVSSFVNEPHNGIIGEPVSIKVLNMVAKESEDCRKACVDIVNENPLKVKRLVKESFSGPLDHWIFGSREIRYEMPLNLDWNLIEELYELKPSKYEEIVEFKGVGPKTIRALALVSEIVFGTPAAWRDPAKFSFAHGGKDGVPYPVDKNTYRNTIAIFKDAIERAKLGSYEKLSALKRLSRLDIY